MRNFTDDDALTYFRTKLGSRLQNARKMANVTQDEMSKETKLTKNYISALERGIHKFNLNTFIEYCETCCIDPNTLLGWDMNTMSVTKERLDHTSDVRKYEMLSNEEVNNFNRLDIYDSYPEFFSFDKEEILKKPSEQRSRVNLKFKDHGGHSFRNAGLRNLAFARDGYRCQICGSAVSDGIQLFARHIIPLSMGGKDELDNIQTICNKCDEGLDSRVKNENPLFENGKK